MTWRQGLLIVAALALLAPAVAAQEVVIRAPFTFVRVGPGVDVVAPFTRVSVLPPPPPIYYAPPPRMVAPSPIVGPMPRRLEQAPPPGPELAPPPKVVEPAQLVRVPTHQEFGRTFVPEAGNYEVVLLHPYSGCPVRVCFSLPPGCPRRVHIDGSELEYHYADREVEIRFRRDGTVKVEYNGKLLPPPPPPPF